MTSCVLHYHWKLQNFCFINHFGKVFMATWFEKKINLRLSMLGPTLSTRQGRWRKGLTASKSNWPSFKNSTFGARDDSVIKSTGYSSWWPSLILSTHTAVLSCSKLQLQRTHFWSPLVSITWYRDIYSDKTPTHIKYRVCERDYLHLLSSCVFL